MNQAYDDIHEKFEMDRINHWMTVIRSLAKQAGCEHVIESMLSDINDTQRETINIAVVGRPNSGKSSHINAMLDRKILPISSLASDCAYTIFPSNNHEDERYVGVNNSGPLSNLASVIAADLISPKQYQIQVNSDWLRMKSIQLFEKPTLDSADEDLYKLIEECLRNVDVVILLIDAIMAVTRSEFIFMSTCIERKLPLVVVVSKLDKLSEEEREDVSTYVAKRIESLDTRIPVVNTSITPALTTGIDIFRSVLDDLISQANLSAIRWQENLHVLQSAVNIVMSVLQINVEAHAKSKAKLDIEIKQGRQLVETMNLEWTKLEQAMHQKRQEMDEKARRFLEEKQHIVLEELIYDLERNNDINVWWQRDLPFRLNRELKSLAGQLSSSMNRSIAHDIRWLQEELLRRFKFPLQVLSEPVFSIRETEIKQNALSLSDSHLFNIISRLGSAASVVVAGTLFTAGMSGLVLAVGTIAGLTADQVADYNTRKDRKIVHAELYKLIQQVLREYVVDFSTKSEAGYAEILSGLRQHQERWNQAQLQALMAYEEKSLVNNSLDWQKLLQEAKEMEAAVQQSSKNGMSTFKVTK